MTLTLLALLMLIAATWWADHRRVRRRHLVGAAVFAISRSSDAASAPGRSPPPCCYGPPVVLILWALPARQLPRIAWTRCETMQGDFRHPDAGRKSTVEITLDGPGIGGAQKSSGRPQTLDPGIPSVPVHDGGHATR